LCSRRPQKSQSLGWPKHFVALGISIAAISFKAYQITQLDTLYSTLKLETDMLIGTTHLHEAHLHHLESKLEWSNSLLACVLEANVWFSSKVIDAFKKKFQSVLYHHKNVIKSA
jgi:hypothetical protein